MTYRGVYRDGVVVLRGEVDLRNGEAVDVSPAGRDRVRGKTIAKAKPATKATGERARSRSSDKATSAKGAPPGAAKSGRAAPAKHPLPGFGAWKHRIDIGDSAAFARELRRRTGSRRLAG